jgi:hypothetical protein
MREYLKELFDLHTAKVIAAVTSPLVVQAFSPERVLNLICLSAGAAYACLKLWRLYYGKEK